MNDDSKQNVNPHTGAPVPADAAPALPAAQDVASSAAAPSPTAAPATPTPATTAAPSQQEMAIRSALETVMDPELSLSVIDLGLIREIVVAPGKTTVRMLLTTPFCPYAPQIIAEIKQAAASVVPQECDVDVLPDPWSPDMMADPGLLGFSY